MLAFRAIIAWHGPAFLPGAVLFRLCHDIAIVSKVIGRKETFFIIDILIALDLSQTAYAAMLLEKLLTIAFCSAILFAPKLTNQRHFKSHCSVVTDEFRGAIRRPGVRLWGSRCCAACWNLVLDLQSLLSAVFELDQDFDVFATCVSRHAIAISRLLK